MIYLDSAATTLQKPRKVAEAASAAVRGLSSPGRGGHRWALKASDKAYSCREAACELFNAESPEKVIFTSNATHALNLAIFSLMKPGDRVLVSGYEHNAVIRPLAALGAEIFYARAAPFDADGLVREFRRLMELDVKLVICTHVSNVFGFVLPLEQVARMCRERGLPLIVDASQSAGVLEIDMQALGAEFIGMPGHKALYGPQGTGILLCRAGVEPLICGGTGSLSELESMPDFLPDRGEAGTHNMPGISGLYEGISFVRRLGTERIRRHEYRLAKKLAEGLSKIPGARVYFADDESLQTGVVSAVFEGMDCEDMARELDSRGIAVRAGLHCAPCAHISAGSIRSGTVRFSVSVFNTEEDIRRAVMAVGSILGTKKVNHRG